MYKQIARQFGLRLSRPITSDNIFFASGIRGNTAKIEKAIQKGLATAVEANHRVYHFGYEEVLDDFYAFSHSVGGLTISEAFLDLVVVMWTLMRQTHGLLLKEKEWWLE